MTENRDPLQVVANLLKLEIRGDEQDWEVELADHRRLSEFMEVYESANLSEQEKFILMGIILGSAERFLEEQRGEVTVVEHLRTLLKQEAFRFPELIDYWKNDDEFLLSSYLQDI